jgi:Fe-S cluster assembly protein SufB
MKPSYIYKNRQISIETVSQTQQILKEVTQTGYKYGFESNIATEIVPKGLNEATIQLISAKKNEPEWMLAWRLKAYRHWLTMQAPKWPNVHYPSIDYQDIIYYAAPQKKPVLNSLDEVDPELLATFKKLGISLEEQKRLANVAIDVVMDSVSVATTFQAKLLELGIIFCSFSEAVQQHPELIKKYLGTVVPPQDNYFAALNAAVFSDGSFCYIPKGVRCPMELSTYFRINAANTGQFERTLIIAEEGAYVSYLEGCTAPMRDENQLHAAVVEIYAAQDAEVRYATIQNWYPGDQDGKGGIYNFVTKRGICAGKNAKISWTQVETGAAITWKYPSCILMGDNSVGEFYSIAVTNNYQQADTGTKMIHLGKNTKSRIVSKGVSAGQGQNSYRGLVKVTREATNARNFSQCDSLLLGNQCGAHTFPYIDVKNNTAQVEHEATTSKIGEEQLFYCNQRGISTEEAVALIVNGYCKEVLNKLPMEFAVEAQKLLALTLEGSVG